MLPAEMQYVVGIDSAKRFHVVCALDARTGKVHLRSRSLMATAAGYADLRVMLQTWGTLCRTIISLRVMHGMGVV